MLTNTRGLITSAIAAVALEPFMVVEIAADNQVRVANAGTPLGVTCEVGANPGETIDVVLTEIAPVRYGADVTAGTRLKAVAGKAVPAAAAEPAFGLATVSGLADSIGAVLLGR